MFVVDVCGGEFSGGWGCVVCVYAGAGGEVALVGPCCGGRGRGRDVAVFPGRGWLGSSHLDGEEKMWVGLDEILECVEEGSDRGEDMDW